METRNNGSRAINELIMPSIQGMRTENTKARKQMKPEYSRFKASLKYKNNDFKKPMFSYDWNKIYENGVPKGTDNEWLGFQSLLLWCLKCIKSGTLESVTIWMTFREDKKTDVMDYDTLILSYHHSKDATELKPIPELEFNHRGKVDLQKLLPVKKLQEQERDRMKAQLRGMGGRNE